MKLIKSLICVLTAFSGGSRNSQMGRRFFFKIYDLEGPGCMLSRKMLKSKDPNNAFCSIFWSKSDRFFLFLGDPEQGGGGAQPGRHLIRHWLWRKRKISYSTLRFLSFVCCCFINFKNFLTGKMK